ncbi:MAG: hypothetical protein J3R72DRAFT_443824 [Linnemannia gamsii]|nr:MAG: hypothetical protein J3R72DRAFT_443824 [Linnemannia gamsii]
MLFVIVVVIVVAVAVVFPDSKNETQKWNALTHALTRALANQNSLSLRNDSDLHLPVSFLFVFSPLFFFKLLVRREPAECGVNFLI